jgi:hypothetical protein
MDKKRLTAMVVVTLFLAVGVFLASTAAAQDRIVINNPRILNFQMTPEKFLKFEFVSGVPLEEVAVTVTNPSSPKENFITFKPADFGIAPDQLEGVAILKKPWTTNQPGMKTFGLCIRDKKGKSSRWIKISCVVD